MLDQRIQGLYGITPNNNLNIALIERIFNEHKVNILQYRHKTNNDKLKLEEAKRLLELCLQHNTLFIVNDDINLCEKVGADGIHFPEKHIFDADTQKLKEDFILGQSVHSLEMAIKAELLYIDYLIVGTLFPSKSHPHGRVNGTKIIEDISGKLSVPLIGIGGISSQNCRKVIDSGASGVAVIGAISEADDPRLESQIILENISVS